MSDEESFVILGSSPLPSLNAEKSGNDTPYCSLGSLQRSELRSAANSLSHMIISQTSNASSAQAEESKNSMNGTINNKTEICANGSTCGSAVGSSSNETSMRQRKFTMSGGSEDASLAASFIMGEINADVLKTSVYSQFPSLCSMEACAEDVVKLQNFMSEYIELKNTLAKVNLTMKLFYDKTQKWKEDMNRMEEQYKQQLQDCQTQIAGFRNENMELKREMETKIEHMQISDELRQKDHNALVQGISEKTAQINNMRTQIEKLEAQQLSSFEYIPKNQNDTKEKPDYVDRLEHQRIVKVHEQQLSALLAENLELKDMQKQYKDEITCLSVNLAAAEELINKSRADISLLQTKDMEKSEIFSNHEAERVAMREELALLREQVNIYSKDFEMERNARQNLAGEKDQLLLDLRALQRRNQELLEEAQKQCARWEKSFASAGSAGAAVKAPSPVMAASVGASATTTAPPSIDEPSSSYRCPLCFKISKSYAELESHVSDCLDK